MSLNNDETQLTQEDPALSPSMSGDESDQNTDPPKSPIDDNPMNVDNDNDDKDDNDPATATASDDETASDDNNNKENKKSKSNRSISKNPRKRRKNPSSSLSPPAKRQKKKQVTHKQTITIKNQKNDYDIDTLKKIPFYKTKISSNKIRNRRDSQFKNVNFSINDFDSFIKYIESDYNNKIFKSIKSITELQGFCECSDNFLSKNINIKILKNCYNKCKITGKDDFDLKKWKNSKSKTLKLLFKAIKDDDDDNDDDDDGSDNDVEIVTKPKKKKKILPSQPTPTPKVNDDDDDSDGDVDMNNNNNNNRTKSKSKTSKKSVIGGKKAKNKKKSLPKIVKDLQLVPKHWRIDDGDDDDDDDVDINDSWKDKSRFARLASKKQKNILSQAFGGGNKMNKIQPSFDPIPKHLNQQNAAPVNNDNVTDEIKENLSMVTVDELQALGVIDDINDPVAINSDQQISFTAEGENCFADIVIMYEPGIEIFLGSLHPKGALYEKVTTRKNVVESYNNFSNKLKSKNIKVYNVRNVLKMNYFKLLNLAEKSLKYVCVSNNSNSNSNNSKIINDNNKYKINDVLPNLCSDDLIDIILCRPTVEYSVDNKNTGIIVKCIKQNPIGNLVFCRDQQITTNVGVVIGRLNSEQRKNEINIMKLVFENLNINIIGQIPNNYNNLNCYLEGGDFIPINKYLSILGVGLRTTQNAANYLMDNDLIGTDRFAIVIDKNDKNQDRMHLDTVFNVLNDKTVIVLDFDTVPLLNQNKNKNISRIVNIYKKNKNNNNKYELISKNMNFYDFLNKEGFNIIKVTHKQQLNYIINFLNIGNGNIISVNKNLKYIIDNYNKKNNNNTNIKIEYIDFDGIKAMYGAAHCSTQVSRIRTTNNSCIRQLPRSL